MAKLLYHPTISIEVNLTPIVWGEVYKYETAVRQIVRKYFPEASSIGTGSAGVSAKLIAHEGLTIAGIADRLRRCRCDLYAYWQTVSREISMEAEGLEEYRKAYLERAGVFVEATPDPVLEESPRGDAPIEESRPKAKGPGIVKANPKGKP